MAHVVLALGSVKYYPAYYAVSGSLCLQTTVLTHQLSTMIFITFSSVTYLGFVWNMHTANPADKFPQQNDT